MIRVNAHAERRELRLVSGRKAFGDASETDAKNQFHAYFMPFKKI